MICLNTVMTCSYQTTEYLINEGNNVMAKCLFSLLAPDPRLPFVQGDAKPLSLVLLSLKGQDMRSIMMSGTG